MKLSLATHPIGYRVVGFALIMLIIASPLFVSAASNYSSKAVAHSFATIAGCPLFPANNIWNYDISKLPTDPNSTNYIRNFGNSILQADFGSRLSGFPYVVVPGSQPYVPIHFTAYASDSDPGPYPIPPNAPIEHNSDRHILVLDSGTCKSYEMWHGSPQPGGSWDAGSGAIFDLTSNMLRPNGKGSADAAGLPMLPGLVRYDEVAAGAITHALRFAGLNPGNRYVWPARHSDGPSTSPNAPPEGSRLRLKASVKISSYSPQNQIILTALKHYGMFLADNGGNYLDLALSGAPDPRWNDNDLWALSKIPSSDFEVVNESSLQVGPNSGRVLIPPTLSTATPTPSITPSATSPVTSSIAIGLVPNHAEETNKRGTNSKGGNVGRTGTINKLPFAFAGAFILLTTIGILLKFRCARRLE